MTPKLNEGHRNGGIEVVVVNLLGDFSVSIGSRIVDEDQWQLRKAAALFKLLALAPNHRLHCEQVMHLLWQRLQPEAAANNLRRNLYSARRTLEPDPQSTARYLARRDGQLVLCAEGSLWVDVDAFEECTAKAHRTHEPADYWTALDLYRGELLPGDRYEEWAETRREQLREIYLVLLKKLSALHGGRGELELKSEAVRRLAYEEPARTEGRVVPAQLYARLEESLGSSAILARMQGSSNEPRENLTEREQEVAVLVAHGLTNRRIAEKLSISERTVDAHLRKVFAKLRLCSRVQLATWAMVRGLLR